MSDILYTAQATAHGGREGSVKSSDGVLDLKLAVPKELGGPGGAATNPEQLFAAGYAACFESAIRFVGRQRHVKFDDVQVTAEVGIGKRDAGGFQLAVKLTAAFTGLEYAQANDLAQAAHHDICPYSHATRGNVEVTVAVTGADGQPLPATNAS
ncbi:organic hydroperoxide resistance protein [Chitiniphilus shinanonensis]|uniref:Organic hydroperoxide resistance protein n=1 Tax=Chitiniphilus shinanonensis TaxID=553088 RepID=A0ABQ6BSN6_9NEIS|nr:organic hydroperoxide resistance protein [Chitiniphilus shinanonensis]GLS03247.1 organic hydroperoxide resistance protein [Chitiniphilus shinanonensis]